MSMILVNTGESYWLDAITPKSISDSWQIGLFKNTPTITRATVLTDLTACDFPGYAALALGTFAAAAIDGSNRAFSSPVSNSFAFTRSSTGTPQAANGYYLFEGSRLIGAETFSSPFTFTSSGDTLTLTELLRLQSDT